MYINPLRYQISEYDCGPTCILNAVSVLFSRDDIPPELIHSIMLHTLDNCNDEGQFGRHGTSADMMRYLSFWFTRFGQTGKLPVRGEFYSGSDVHMNEGSPVLQALDAGGVVILRVWLDVGHYILLTGREGNDVLAFDPYFDSDRRFPHDGIAVVEDQPHRYNRKIPISTLAAMESKDYAMEEEPLHEALILYNTTKQ